MQSLACLAMPCFNKSRSSKYNLLLHSALKLEKSAILKVQKHIFYYFKNGKKSIFCTRKKFKTSKNAIFGIFSGAKIDFLRFLKWQKMCSCTFKIALFSNFKAV